MFTYLVTAFMNVHKCWVHHSRMRRSLTIAETVRLWSDSGSAAHQQTKSIRHREIGPVQSATVLSDCGQAAGLDRLQPWAEIAWVSVRQTPDSHWRRPLGWSFMGRWQAWVASRYGCPRRGSGGCGAWSISWSDVCRPTIPAASWRDS